MISLSIFSERLNDLVSESGLTQKQIAKATNLTETSISEYLRGVSEPTIKYLVAIADYFVCTTDFLLGKTATYTEKSFLTCPHFADRLKYLLKKKKCTGYFLCKNAEIPEGSFYDWKNGKTQPSLDNLEKLANFFDCSFDYLLGREN